MPIKARPACVAVSVLPSSISRFLTLYEARKQEQKRVEEEKKRAEQQKRIEAEKPKGRAALTPFLRGY